MATLELRRLNKTHDDGTVAVADLDLRIADGELFVLIGPSGCGKTTVLRAVAGLDEVTYGDVLIDDQPVTYVAANARDVAMVFQNNVLFPHLSVRDNIAFALTLAKVRKSVKAQRVDEVAALLHLSELLDRFPNQLSGGQQQRAAIGRAIVRRPRLLLMDEPLSSLDAQLRTELRSQIVELQHRLGVTTLYVTHDQVEAMAMADRVAIMRDGQVVQIGTPLELYRDPVDLFVAQFLGAPTMNAVVASVQATERGFGVRVGGAVIELDALACARLPHVGQLVGRRVVLGMRAEALSHDPGGQLIVSAVAVEQHGSDRFVRATIGANPVVHTGSSIAVDIEPLAELTIRVDHTDEIDFFQPFVLNIDTLRIHLFDLDSGRALAR